MKGTVVLPAIQKADVFNTIRSIVKQDTEKIDILVHARMRMLEREITIRQVYKVLEFGELAGEVIWDPNGEKGWKCKLSRMVAGESVTVIAKLVQREASTCLVVTVW